MTKPLPLWSRYFEANSIIELYNLITFLALERKPHGKPAEDGADQPATAPEPKPKGDSEPQPESEVRPQ